VPMPTRALPSGTPHDAYATRTSPATSARIAS
jgi:hypothetical protein